MKLRDKVAIITGGAKGIGLGCARVFSRHGAIVILADKNEPAATNAASELVAAGAQAFGQRCDVTIEDDLRRVIERAVADHGRLDCLVSNAGWHPPARTIDETTVEEFEAQLRLNLTSTFMGCRLAVPHLRRTKGSLVIVSSEVALMGQAQACAYVASKAGQVGLTRALALDLVRDGVRVNAVCPSNVMTPLMREWAASLDDPAAALRAVERTQPGGVMASPEEIGEVCAFLASSEASFVTGQAFPVDGGASLGYGIKSD